MEISVIVVNWNAGEMLGECLNRILRELESVRGECIVIDNASDNGDRNLLKREFPQLEVVQNQTNLGFAKAVNQGIRRSRGRYLLLINPDAFVSEGAIASAVSFLDSRPEIGILGPRILNPDGSIQGSARAFPQFATAFFGRTSLASRLFPDNGLTRRQVLCFDSELNRPLAVDWVSGASIFLRRELIEDVGLLDEGFFLYWEDADICARARQGGWSVIYHPNISVTHVVGVSSRHAPIRSSIAFHRSAYRWYRLHVTRSHFHPLSVVAASGLMLHFGGKLCWRGIDRLLRQLKLSRRESARHLDHSIKEHLFWKPGFRDFDPSEK